MKQTWRWFGPNDLATIDDVRQAGATGVVSALHHIPSGAVWAPGEIEKRRLEIECREDGSPSGVNWEVVESLPVSEDIKKQSGDWRQHIANYIESLSNLAAAGIDIVCYNFMPILDWTRTDLAYRLPNGATCMRFDLVDFAAFDIHILERRDAAQDYPDDIREEARRRLSTMSDEAQEQLVRNIVCGLPGAHENLSLQDVTGLLETYAHVSDDVLRGNQIAFLESVAPAAEELGIRLCCHPDDPPFPLLSLPRVMSCEDDYRRLMDAVDTPANGITLCSGSLGVLPDNDLPGMMQRLGDRVHFLHLRNVKRETRLPVGSFHEAEHLEGDTDMVALLKVVLEEETRRNQAGRADHSIPFRPDHGHDIVYDLGRGGQPGYPLVGRLKGLAELRGIITALSHQ